MEFTPEQLENLGKSLGKNLEKIGFEIDKSGNIIATSSSKIATALNSGAVNISDATSVFTDVANKLPVIGGILSSFGNVVGDAANYVQGSIDVYTELSKVGGGLSGSLLELRSAATESRMGFKEFANFVKDNSEVLAGFPGGVAAGTRAVGQFGKDLRETGLDVAFENLGYKTDEITEFTVKYLAANQRSMRIQNASREMQIEQTLVYAKQLSTISKLTGKNASQMADELANRKRDGATQAALRLAEMKGGKGAVQAYEAAQTALEKSPGVVQDLMDDLLQTGVPMTDATKNFAALNGEAYALLQEAAAATKRGDTAEAQRLAEEAAAQTAAFAQSEQGLTIATLSQVSEVAKVQADSLSEIGTVIDAVKSNMDALEAATGDSDEFLRAWNTSVGNITSKVDQQADGLVEGTNILRVVNDTNRELTEANIELQRKVQGALVNVELGATDFAARYSQDVSGVGNNTVDAIAASIDNLISDSVSPKDIVTALQEDKAKRDELKISDEEFAKLETYANLLEKNGAENLSQVQNLYKELEHILTLEPKDEDPDTQKAMQQFINELNVKKQNEAKQVMQIEAEVIESIKDNPPPDYRPADDDTAKVEDVSDVPAKVPLLTPIVQKEPDFDITNPKNIDLALKQENFNVSLPTMDVDLTDKIQYKNLAITEIKPEQYLDIQEPQLQQIEANYEVINREQEIIVANYDVINREQETIEANYIVKQPQTTVIDPSIQIKETEPIELDQNDFVKLARFTPVEIDQEQIAKVNEFQPTEVDASQLISLDTTPVNEQLQLDLDSKDADAQEIASVLENIKQSYGSEVAEDSNKLLNELLTTGIPVSEESQSFSLENPEIYTQLSDAIGMIQDNESNYKLPNTKDLFVKDTFDMKKIDELITSSNQTNDLLSQLIESMSISKSNNSVSKDEAIVKVLNDLNTATRELVDINTRTMNLNQKSLNLAKENTMYA